jgi:predicted nuclease of predicted toxin-antitoxin system
MVRIKIYLDEDVSMAVSRALRIRGIEAYTTGEKGKTENSDEEQLEYATSIKAVLLTHNVQDFPRIHHEFMKLGKHHAGIIIAKQISVGEILKSTLLLASALSEEDIKDRILINKQQPIIYYLK